MGARPMGMGDAFAAIVDDMNAVDYNPAGLALEKNIEFTLEYANLYAGLDDGLLQENHLAYAQSFYDSGGGGVAWNNRSLNQVYSENEILIGYALRLVDELPLWAGVTGKMFFLQYTDPQSLQANPFFSNGSKAFDWGMDLGLLYDLLAEAEYWPGVRLGLGVFNLNQPDLGLKSDAKQPLTLRAGAGLVWDEWDGAVDLVQQESAMQVHAGAEKWFMKKTLGVRTGVMTGTGTALTWTMGASYNFSVSPLTLRLNYAFNYSFGGVWETAGIHRLSMDCLYPLPTKEELKKIEEERRRQAQIELEKNQQRVFELFEKARGKIVQMEISPINKSYPEKVSAFKKELQDVGMLRAHLQLSAAISRLERLLRDMGELETAHQKLTSEQQAQEQRINAEKNAQVAKRAELVRLVKSYLVQRFLVYASTRQKINALRASADPGHDRQLYGAELKLCEARDSIVQNRDLRGFLRKLKEAVKQVEEVERSILAAKAQ